MEVWNRKTMGSVGVALYAILAIAAAIGAGACSKASEDHAASGQEAQMDDSGQQEEAAAATAHEVIVLPSGLKYEVIESGSGASPNLTDKVTVHYRGTLTDGTEFDSSYKRGQPAQFPVNRVIAGWTEALQLMKEGDKWNLTIPPDLAYGERGAGNAIPPNATLQFEVELIKVN